MNGPPAVGKSSLAALYRDDHPLTLLIEIDDLRVSLGQWEDHEDSKLLARELAVAMAMAHLRGGHDVIFPQYLGRLDFIETLDDAAQRADADFVEVVLLGSEPLVTERFLSRRRELPSQARPHPQAEVLDASVAATIADALERLGAVAARRPGARVMATLDDIDETYEALLAVIGDDGP